MQMKSTSTVTARRKTLHVKPTLPPSPPRAASQLDGLQDGRWVPEKIMAASLRDTDEPSTWFPGLFSLGVCCHPARREDCYGFVLP